MDVEQITIDEFQARLKSQDVGERQHMAVKCPVCGTVQSMASLVAVGVPAENAEDYIGFSCEGRFSGSGPWPSRMDESEAAATRRKVRGCDWTLGGLFKIHRLEVVALGKAHPMFEAATKEEACALKAEIISRTTQAADGGAA